MVNYKRVSVYLPEELYQALMAYQEQQKFEAASETVVEILSQFLEKDNSQLFRKGNQVKRYATEEQLKALEGKVTSLNQQVAQLHQLVASSTAIAFPRVTSSENNDCTFGDSSFDEVGEEPDEILYDFLEPGSPPPSKE